MTISSEVRKAGPFDGNDSTTEFPFAFKVFGASDLYVVQADATGTETVLTLTTHYTVALNADQNADPGGTVTLLAALATGTTLVVSSELPNLQPTDLTNNGGFYPKVITNALDRLTILVQQLVEKVSRSLKMAISTPDGVDAQLPAPVPYALIGWNSTGTGFQNADVAYSTALATDMASTANNKGGSLIGYSAIASAVAGTLAAAVSSRGVSVKDFPFLAFGDGVTDDYAALQSWLTYASTGAAVAVLPPGNYYCNGNLTCSGSLTIQGAGSDLSRIKFGANCNLTYVSSESTFHDGDRLTIENAGFRTTNQNTKAVLDIDGNTVNGGTRLSVLLNGLDICGDGNTNGFDAGIKFTDCSYTKINACRIRGDSQSNTLSQNGVLFQGAATVVEVVITNSDFFFVGNAINLQPTVSGVYINRCTLVAVGVGINQTSTVSNVGFIVTSCHIDSAIACIRTNGMLQYNIANNLLYADETTRFPSATSTCLEFTNSQAGLAVNGNITGNNLIGVAATATTTGISFKAGAGSERVIVANNNIIGMDEGINIGVGVNNLVIRDTNTFSGAGATVVNNSGMTGNVIDITSTWTPTLTFGGAAVGITYTTQTGKYIRKGNLISVDFELLLSAKGSSTGAAVIGGLPFTRDSTAWPLANIACVSGGATITNFIGSYVTKSAATIELKAQGAAASSNITDANFTNTTRLIGSVTYTVA